MPGAAWVSPAPRPVEQYHRQQRRERLPSLPPGVDRQPARSPHPGKPGNQPVKARYLLVLVVLAAGAFAESAPDHRDECVVLLHGLWRTELSMLAVQWKLSDAGYQVVNVTYPSLLYPIEGLAAMAVGEGLAECSERGLQRIHFVTHSLGGILVRQFLAQREIPGLGRVVMLAPPNRGSQLADYVQSLGLPDFLQPAAVDQLGTAQDSVPRRLGPVHFELGVIAGNSNRHISLPGVPKAANDGTVAVAETRVPGMTDFIEVSAGHTFIMWKPDVLEQVLYFLEHGRFDRGELPGPVAM
jgi:pimeloyl-ACP methyl ester carboxylesterase